MNGKPLVVALILAGILLGAAGCVTPAAYQPVAYNSIGQGIGFSSRRTGQTSFQVDFVGNPKTSAQRVRDFALLRTAEIALENRFVYFVVLRDLPEKQIMNQPDLRDYGIDGGRDTAAAADSWADGAAPKYAVNRMTFVIECYTNRPQSVRQGNVYDAQRLSAELRIKYGLAALKE